MPGGDVSASGNGSECARAGRGVGIEGHVYRVDTEAPLGKARLSLERIDSHGPGDWLRNYEAVSDAEGGFTLAGIARGQYRLRVSRNGFLDGLYGAKGGQASGAVLDLESPQKLKKSTFDWWLLAW